MKKTNITTEKRKIPTTTNYKTYQRRVQPTQNRIRSSQNNNGIKRTQTNMIISKYNDLNRDISKIIRTINLLFDFKTFTKEKLQPLESVRQHVFIILFSILLN